ncbi:MAG: Spy/CpxP family protein refolding chaperone [Planctomycetota bacterium]|nr:Spy/CpxP family protein refolding chaperone [Planctomycetota bacterium]
MLAAHGGGGHGAAGHGQGGGKATDAAAQGGDGQDAQGQGGPGPMLPPPPGTILDFVMQHAADIKLTDEQKKKLEDLKKTLPPPPEKPVKPVKDPELMELYKKMMAAKQSGDTDAVEALRKQIADKIKQIAPDGGKCMDGLKAILTPEQMAKLKELWQATQKAGAGRGAGGQGGGHGGGQGGPHGGAKGGGRGGAPEPCPFDL